MKLSTAYVGTRECIWQSVFLRMATRAPIQRFAPFTQFNSAGHAIGGFGPEVDHEQRIAFELSRAANEPDGKLLSRGLEPAGELHIFEIDRRYKRGTGWLLRTQERFCKRCRRIHGIRKWKRDRRPSMCATCFRSV